jgi:site-specific DNA recombinase
MPNTNGHGPKRAILYARVSTDEQARSGYSLAQQLEALRAYAAREGYEVLEEVVDPGQSGASLERPGMDRTRDLVSAGGVSVVLAQDRDRLSREPAYTYLLRREFEEHGCELRSLNDRGDGSPEGDLTDGILDQLAKYERAKIAERSRRGKLRKAREGKIICGHTPGYGFRYNETRDGYEVEPHNMAVVRRIFSLIGSGGESLSGTARTLERDGVRSPSGNRVWVKPTIKGIVLDDAYRTLSYEQMQDLAAEGHLTADVLSRLDREKRYGIWWFNRSHKTQKRAAVDTPNGREYKTRSKSVARPRSEWIAVPVPDCGVPPELVDAARNAVKDNRSPSSAGRRVFDLSGGVLHCAACGRRMGGTSVLDPKTDRRYFYYTCSRLRNSDSAGCETKIRSVRADVLEPRIWGFVSGLILEPAG